MSVTQFYVKNNVTIPGKDAMHFIVYQKPEDPSLDTEVLVWKRVAIQSGGTGMIPIPFSVTYTATVTDTEGIESTTPQVPAMNGDVLILSRDPESNAPMLTKDLSQSDPKGSGRNYAKIINHYDKVQNITVQCNKLDHPLVEQTMRVQGDSAQFDVYPVIFLAWDSDLKEGDTFRSGQFAAKTSRIDLSLPSGNPAQKVTVDVTSYGNAIKVGQPIIQQ